MTSSANLALEFIESGQGSAQIPHNEALRTLDALVQCAVLDRDLTTAPVAAEGDRYIVGTGAGGDWFGHDGKIAYWDGTQWVMETPKTGWQVWVEDEGIVLTYLTSWKSTLGPAIIALRDATGAQNIAGAWTAILWRNSDRKDAGVYTHSTSANQDQITLIEAGDYQVGYRVGLTATATAGISTVETRLTLGGTLIAGSLSQQSMLFGTTDKVTLCGSVFVRTASANQILRVEAQRTAGTTTLGTVAAYNGCIVRRI